MIRETFAHQVIRASAGSGKTHQLTNRYLRLLAEGVEPDAILATTFTRKAAGEILDRVLARLAGAAGDAGKAKQLTAQIQAKNDSPQDYSALLRGMLRSLHRVRISTLDSFYIALASSFSLELGLPPGWQICEAADDDVLRREALERLLDQQPEDIRNLLPLLSKGETRRSIHENLFAVIGAHYESFRESDPSAWKRLQVPAPLDAAKLTASLERLRVFDFAACRDKRFFSARDEDISRFEQGAWPKFIGGGLAAKVLAREPTYFKKQIPQEAQGLYQALVEHACSRILQRLAEQTAATWELLDRFHRDLWGIKQATGALRFGEVTQALVVALQRQVLRADALAFRLDGAVDHLLLDEFQDTSLTQWRVLEPIARRITRQPADVPRSFFCVGDVKQAIFGWRGGMAEILNTLEDSLGPLQNETLVESRRSVQPIIDLVNEVFGNLCEFQGGSKCQDGLASWEFQAHSTHKKDVPGYACLQTGPKQAEGEDTHGQRSRHCEHVAMKIRDMVQQMRDRSFGVLCRKNDTVARMIYELRQLHVEASEEGGKSLTDSPAVEIILSLFTLADHPGHSIAWFHLRNSPLKDHLESFANANALATFLRRDLLTKGYGEFTHGWAKALAPSCDRRDLGRLQQLVEMAYGYQARSTLRADAFVTLIRLQRVPDPSGANVRVMTMHGAKGLQFDVVVVPELDAGLMGHAPAFVVRRGPKSLDVDFVCRYADEVVQNLMQEEERRAFELFRQQSVEESLSLLYVALTRAIHAMYLFIPGPRKRGESNAWHHLLLATLASGKQPTENTLLYERGDEGWFRQTQASAALGATPAPDQVERIAFRPPATERRRGLEHVAPSSREGQARVRLDRLFRPPEGTGAAAGTLYHLWFSLIGWLDDGAPTEDQLRAAAEKIRADLPQGIWRDLTRLLANFKSWLQKPAISGVLRRAAYSDPKQPAFPTVLAPFLTKTIVLQKVEQERRFLVRDGAKFWNGCFDRIVWLGDGDRTVAADVIDFKTDAIPPGDAKALAVRVAHYRPQLEAYRRAVARMAQLPEERVATRLVFTEAACVVGI